MPTTAWADVSEIVTGLVLTGKLTPNAVRPSTLIEPYPHLWAGMKKSKKVPAPERIIELIGLSAYQAALKAAKAVNGLPANWITVLEQSAARHDLGQTMEKMAKRLLHGEDVDMTRLQAALQRSDDHLPQIVPLSRIPPETNQYELTGYQPIDQYMGGLPMSSLTMAVGAPGTGKTYLFLRLAAAYAAQGKVALLFSMEMTAKQLAFRAKNDMKLPKKIHERILIFEDTVSPEEISQIIARMPDVSFFAVDFAEQMIVDKSESEMAEGYRVIAACARNTHKTGLILSQETKMAMQNIPGMGSARYTGLADAFIACGIGIYNPEMIFLGNGGMPAENDPLLLAPGSAALVHFKARYGYKMGSPGAVEIPWKPGIGWADTALGWHKLGGSPRRNGNGKR